LDKKVKCDRQIRWKGRKYIMGRSGERENYAKTIITSALECRGWRLESLAKLRPRAASGITVMVRWKGIQNYYLRI
jgi:hypothetical protein